MPEAIPPVFRRAVIALSGGAVDETVVRLALEFGRASRAELIAIHVVELNWTQPLDADVAFGAGIALAAMLAALFTWLFCRRAGLSPAGAAAATAGALVIVQAAPRSSRADGRLAEIRTIGLVAGAFGLLTAIAWAGLDWSGRLPEPGLGGAASPELSPIEIAGSTR